MSVFRLAVDNAVVTVREQEGGRWRYSFTYLDGSSQVGDSDYTYSERSAKEWAVATYRVKMGTNKPEKVRWKRVNDED